jgi:hypothetical protein
MTAQKGIRKTCGEGSTGRNRKGWRGQHREEQEGVVGEMD